MLCYYSYSYYYLHAYCNKYMVLNNLNGIWHDMIFFKTIYSLFIYLPHQGDMILYTSYYIYLIYYSYNNILVRV